MSFTKQPSLYLHLERAMHPHASYFQASYWLSLTQLVITQLFGLVTSCSLTSQLHASYIQPVFFLSIFSQKLLANYCRLVKAVFGQLLAGFCVCSQWLAIFRLVTCYFLQVVTRFSVYLITIIYVQVSQQLFLFSQLNASCFSLATINFSSSQLQARYFSTYQLLVTLYLFLSSYQLFMFSQ